MVEPHGTQTHALLQVVHPISSNVNQASQSTWQDEEEESRKEKRDEEVKARRSRKQEKGSRQLAVFTCASYLCTDGLVIFHLERVRIAAVC